MFETPDHLPSPTGARLLLRRASAEGRPRGVVLLIHGLAEHSGRYAPLARTLAAAGFHLYAHDHRGHGGTSAPDAPLRTFAKRDGAHKVLLDAQAVEALARREHPGLKAIVLGHSMGGLVALHLARRRGAELSGACIWNIDLSQRSQALAGLIALRAERAFRGSDVASALFPRLTIDAWAKSIVPRRTEADWLSHDAATVDAFLADPLCGFRPTVSMAEDILRLVVSGTTAAALAAIPRHLPIHLLGGSADPATHGGRDVEAFSRRLRALGFPDVETVIVEGSRHEPLVEAPAYREPATAALMRWLDRVVN